MITTVTFDVWETMIHDDAVLSAERSELRVARMARALSGAGHHVAEARLRAAYEACWQRFEDVWATDRELDTPAQLTIMLSAVDRDLEARFRDSGIDGLEAAYVDPIYDLPPVLNDGLVEALRALKARNMRLGLICNTGRTPGYALRHLLTEYGVLGYFDTLAFSNEEEIRKPNPEIFRRVLDRLGAPPFEAVHIGDNLIADIAGAKRSGMRAILIQATGHRARKLENDPRAGRPDARIASLHELPAALERLEGGTKG